MEREALIEKALQAWQPYYEQELSQREGEEIVSNWSAYIELISQWASVIQERGKGA